MTAIKFGRSYSPWLLCLAAVSVAAFALFGFAGFRTIIAVAVLFIIPPLLLLRKSGLDSEEKIFFSLFIGLGLFPLLVFAINQLLPSFRASAVAALIIVAIAAFLINLFRQKGFAVAAFFVPRILQRKRKL